jgi:hypothetical protein
MTVSNKLQAFFEGVQRAGNTLDLDLIDSQFADQFIFADPNGTRIIEKARFLPALPKRQEFFKSLGHLSTEILALDETPIDDQYTMVKAHFLMQFQKPNGQIQEARVDSTYILFIKQDLPRIVMQIEHEDLQQAMKDRGLL